MGRYFFEVAYNGKKYHGWQIQKNAHSVQEEFNNALKQLFGIAVETVASGRTDTGVHAEQQYIHLDLLFQITADHVFKLNKIKMVSIPFFRYSIIFIYFLSNYVRYIEKTAVC